MFIVGNVIRDTFNDYAFETSQPFIVRHRFTKLYFLNVKNFQLVHYWKTRSYVRDEY